VAKINNDKIVIMSYLFFQKRLTFVQFALGN
jgi:hypothetical protein